MKAEELLHWARRDFFRHSGEEHFDIIEAGEKEIRFRLYTDVNQYLLRGKIDSNGGLMSAAGSSRKPRAGETHTRGKDLTTGPFNEETWDRIKNDIISFELVKVRRK